MRTQVSNADRALRTRYKTRRKVLHWINSRTNVFINGSCSFPKRARSYRFNHTRSIAEKEKEYTESPKIDELYEFSNDSSRDSMINRRNDITQGWQFCSNIALEKEEEKRKKNSYCNTGYSYLVTHPSTNYAEQDLTLLNQRNMLLSLWCSDSALNVFFEFLRWEKV